MAKTGTSDPDLGRGRVTGTFAATGSSSAVVLLDHAHLALWGTFTATTILERSFDGGTTWLPVFHQNGGAAISFTAAVCMVIHCGNEDGVLHRLRCTAYTSGTVNYRLSQ